MFSETQSGCRDFWTAGQRIDPSRESPFIWRVTSTNSCSETVSAMNYTNWNRGEPNYVNQQESCMEVSYLWDGWNDHRCNMTLCAVCELDM